MITNPADWDPALLDEDFIVFGKTEVEWTEYLEMINRYNQLLHSRELKQLSKDLVLGDAWEEMDRLRARVSKRKVEKGTSEEIGCLEWLERKWKPYLDSKLKTEEGDNEELAKQEFEYFAAAQEMDEMEKQVLEKDEHHEEDEEEEQEEKHNGDEGTDGDVMVKEEENEDEDIEVQEGIKHLQIADDDQDAMEE